MTRREARRIRTVLAVGVASVALFGTACSSSETGGGSDPSNPGEGGSDTPRTLRVPEDHLHIQDAVDDAGEGDLILIAPGTYAEGVTVETAGLTIRGLDRNEVILDGGGEIENGFAVFSDAVTIENLTVRAFRGNGVFFTGGYAEGDPLSGFATRFVTAHANGLYGIYAFGARGGVIEDTYTSGHPDAGLYVGQCFPCDTVLRDNVAEFNQNGFEAANAGGDLYVVSSTFRHNRVGVQVFSTTRENLYPQREAVVIANRVTDNVGEGAPSSTDAHGSGVVVAGGHDNRIERNVVTGHPVAGITITRHDEFLAESNRVTDNTATANTVDLVYVNGTDETLSNCFGANTFDSSSPAGIESVLGCATDSTGGRGALAVPPPPPPVDPESVPPPPAQPSMENPEGRAASPATANVPDVDEASLEVPTA